MEIKDFRICKILHEMNRYGDIYEYAEAKMEENDAYWGTDLNKKKGAAFDRMRELCVQICAADKKVSMSTTFDNTTRHGMVTLSFPMLFFSTDTRKSDLLSQLFAAADDIAFSALGDKIRMSFVLRNMWNNHGTIYDRKGG